MKKALLILLSIMMLTGCGGNKNEQTTEPKQLLHISDYFKDKGIIIDQIEAKYQNENDPSGVIRN